MKTAPFVLRKGSVPKKYDHISFVPPKGVRDEAKRGLKLRREHGRGGLSTKQASSHGIGSGVQRAATLASGGRVSPSTIKRMRSFFARHSAYKEHHKDRTSAAYISWLLWGGDAGERWANKVYAQMQRADEEMKKAVAGGERAGHKYIRRIRTARNGRMGWRYIYKKPGVQERSSGAGITPDFFDDEGLEGVVVRRSDTELEDTEDAFAVKFMDGSYGLLDADKLFALLDGDAEGPQFDVVALLEFDLRDLATDWEPDDIASSVLDSGIDHSGTFEAMTEAPMGEQEPLSLDPTPANDGESAPNVEGEEDDAPSSDGVDTASSEDEPPDLEAAAEQHETPTETLRENGLPDLEAAAEQHETLTETLRENEQLEPLADAIDAIAPVKDGKINLPVKDVGKAIALLTLITAVETYKTATVENDNAPDLNDLESASRRGLKQIDKDKIAEAKAKMRESLNKERQAAREKMTREKLAARLKERQEKNKAAKERQEARDQMTREKLATRLKETEAKIKAAKEAQERELEFRKQEAELKQQRKQEAKDKQVSRKEEKAREREAAKKKKAEEAEKKAEEAAAAKRQKEKDAADKKKLDAFEARAQERKEEKEARKKRAAETPRKKRKEKRSEAAKEAKEERKLEKEKANKEKEKADKKKTEAFQEAAAQRAKKVPKRVPKRVRRGNR